MTDETRNDQGPTDEPPQKTQTRRQLLKGLAGTGIAAGMMAIPNKWTKPVVEVGVLPVHAQGSEPPPYSLLRCSVTGYVVGQEIVPGEIYPVSTLQMTAWITPGDAGIQLRRTVTLNEPGHPQDGVPHEWTGPTGVGGMCQSADFALMTLAPTIILPGVGRIVVAWSFVNAVDGLNTCSTNIDIVGLRPT